MIAWNIYSVDSSYGTKMKLEDQLVKSLGIEQGINLRLIINWKTGNEI